MKKILFSIAGIVAVAALVVTSTGALFSDTETSTGNVFTAGAIDLKVDHLKQTYNDVNCETCSVDVYSSTATKIVAASAGASVQGPFPVQAVDVSNPHTAWESEADLPPAQWIWATDPTTQNDTTNNAEYTFENKFQWNGTAVSVALDLALASDNGYKIILNGTTIVDKISTQYNYAAAVSLSGTEANNFKAAMVNGENTLDIVVRNMSYPGGPSGNPAGLLFKLNVHRDQVECAADSAFQQACRLWTEKDLTQADHFWMFNDVKPGDHGTNVISLHPYNNDAYVCLYSTKLNDQDVTINEPEADYPDPQTPNPGVGELAQYIKLFAWNDLNGNGLYEPGAEGSPLVPANTQIDTEMVQLALAGSQTSNVGVAWCMGTQSVDLGTGVISCNGAGNHNDAQTDSLTLDMVAYAVQQRNNPNFSCVEEFRQPK